MLAWDDADLTDDFCNQLENQLKQFVEGEKAAVSGAVSTGNTRTG